MSNMSKNSKRCKIASKRCLTLPKPIMISAFNNQKINTKRHSYSCRKNSMTLRLAMINR